MRRSVSCLALGVGLLVGSLNAQGQTHGPIFLAQAPVTVPPSGVLPTQPPAPVAVPPSGVLATQPPASVAAPPSGVPAVERRTVATQKLQTIRTRTSVTMRRHVVPWRFAARRATIRGTTTVEPSIAATPSVVSATAEQPRHDGIGYELFLSQLGKAKQAR
jgi:hypothetical protein